MSKENGVQSILLAEMTAKKEDLKQSIVQSNELLAVCESAENKGEPIAAAVSDKIKQLLGPSEEDRPKAAGSKNILKSMKNFPKPGHKFD